MDAHFSETRGISNGAGSNATLDPRRPAEAQLDAREFWSNRAGRPFTEEEVRQLTANLVGFFDLLDRWDRKDRARD